MLKYENDFYILEYKEDIILTLGAGNVTKLASDIEFAKRETPHIYQETNEWLRMKNNPLKM